MAVSIINLTEKRERRLRMFLREMFTDIATRRPALLDRLAMNTRRWEAKSKRKDFPWVGASSVHPPLVAAHGDAIIARTVNALNHHERKIGVVPHVEFEIPNVLDPETAQPYTWRTFAEDLETYLNWEVSMMGNVDLRGIEEDLTLETVQAGTGFLATCFEVRRERDYDDSGMLTYDETVYANVHIRVDRIEDLWFPPHYPSLARIPMFSRYYTLRPSEMLQRAGDEGTHQWSLDVVKEFIASMAGHREPIDDSRRAQAEADGTQDPYEFTTEERGVFESWIRFDLDGDGKERRLLVDHAGTADDPMRFIFGVRPWPYPFLPWDASGYIRRRGRLLSMSLPERMESIDEGLATLFNQTIDNVTLANTRFMKGISGSLAARTWGTVGPGELLGVESMDEIEAMQIGEVYPSIFELLNWFKMLAESVSKINDFGMGRDPASEGSTATGIATLTRVSNQYHDTTTRGIRTALSSALNKWVLLLSIYRGAVADRIRQVLGKRADPVLAVLSLPIDDLRKRIGVEISYSSTAATRELARQEEMAKFQILENYYGKLIELAMFRVQAEMGGNAFLVNLADQIARDAELHMRRLLEAFGESYSTTTLPSWDKVLNEIGGKRPEQLAAGAVLSGGSASAGVGVGGAGGPAGAEGQPGMGAPAGAGGGPPGGGPERPPQGGQ